MRVPVIAGPTAVGKTGIAVELARRLDLDLLSADSRQIYAWADLGTAKPSPEQLSAVRFHMIGCVQPDAVYSAADYARQATAILHRLGRESRQAIVVGGSGLYIKALFEPLFEAPRPDPRLRQSLEARSTKELWQRLTAVDPARAAEISPNDRRRICRALEVYEATGRTMSEHLSCRQRPSDLQPVYYVLSLPRAEIDARIEARFDRMVASGLVDEVRQIRDAGFGPDSHIAEAYGYRELMLFLDGSLSFEEAAERTRAKTRSYARRQLTWFRRLPDACWLDCHDRGRTVETLVGLVARDLGIDNCQSAGGRIGRYGE